MSIGKRLRDFFGNPQAAAIGRMRKKVHARAEWDDVKDDIFPEKGVGAPVSSVVAAIIEAKHFKLLTPLAAEAGDWIGVIDLVYRAGEHGKQPPGRAQELEEIYTALKAAPKHGKKLAESLITTAANWACQHADEAVYDWLSKKPEFTALPGLGLAALADHPIEGNKLAMKLLATPADIDRAIEAVEWVYHGNAGDRDDALDNLAVWRKKLEDDSKKPGKPKPPGFSPR